MKHWIIIATLAIGATLLLALLRVMGVVAWPWWLLLLPLWIGLGLAALVLLIMAIDIAVHRARGRNPWQ
ncbi:hypothetical protein [Dyella sp.]|uniref:hypothetical protein n=1 Tax=Dyella sp. TaxID=1869338 RepID=UPI002ED1299B